jgi:hypothetical protein
LFSSLIGFVGWWPISFKFKYLIRALLIAAEALIKETAGIGRRHSFLLSARKKNL